MFKNNGLDAAVCASLLIFGCVPARTEAVTTKSLLAGVVGLTALGASQAGPVTGMAMYGITKVLGWGIAAGSTAIATVGLVTAIPVAAATVVTTAGGTTVAAASVAGGAAGGTFLAGLTGSLTTAITMGAGAIAGVGAAIEGAAWGAFTIGEFLPLP